MIHAIKFPFRTETVRQPSNKMVGRDCFSRSEGLFWATDSQGLGSQSVEPKPDRGNAIPNTRQPSTKRQSQDRLSRGEPGEFPICTGTRTFPPGTPSATTQPH